jgi:hypothetical protein
MRTSTGKSKILLIDGSYQVDMDFEKTGNIKCMQEFLPNEAMFCIVMLKSGFLKMAGCTLSLE